MTQVSELIGDVSNQQWSATRIQDRIEKAQEQFVSDTLCLRGYTTFSIGAGTDSYPLTTDVLDVTRVKIVGKGPLTRTSKFDMDLDAGGTWDSTTGSPSRFYVEPLTSDAWATTNYLSIKIWPIPQDADAGTDNLVVEFLQNPPSLTTDSTYPFKGISNLSHYSDALAFYAASQILLASANPQDWTKARVLRGEYEALVTKCRALFTDMPEATPLRMRLYGVGRTVNGSR